MAKRTWSGWALDVASVVVPGVGRVRAQKIPFALAWSEANQAALSSDRPLWVALGDSMTQGIGARTITGGWVPRLNTRVGGRFAVVNLSTSGARVADVLGDQLPRMLTLPSAPALVTVLIGANDMLTPARRRGVENRFAELLDRLPAGRSVVASLPHGNATANAVNALLDTAGARGRIQVADMRGPALGPLRGSLAEDWFHPNDVGYARIAGIFEAPVRTVASFRIGD
ncbi:SGNH/GDSL hydrolase family protein [Amycolatopsis decaplanina]|uniref:GDSL-like protein n=1 Tax=Amycolatopsis decaplanina DSM 44594 TaxID=1284240 RepID=M2ZKQ5_9PSEU|nr:SGNH/GDSL hydrolase family protein [Amycolatopsis decaplanina]EME60954.1 GDSL-like protein [Amycolatopsis decaplanina DSM 44594]